MVKRIVFIQPLAIRIFYLPQNFMFSLTRKSINSGITKKSTISSFQEVKKKKNHSLTFPLFQTLLTVVRRNLIKLYVITHTQSYRATVMMNEFSFTFVTETDRSETCGDC